MSAGVVSETLNNTPTRSHNQDIQIVQHGDNGLLTARVGEMDHHMKCDVGHDVKDVVDDAQMNEIGEHDESEISSCSGSGPRSVTPKIQRLKKMLQRKERLSEKRARKIKVLQQTIRRLSKKNDSLKKITRKFNKNNPHNGEELHNVPSAGVIKTDINCTVYQKQDYKATKDDELEVCRACLVSGVRLIPLNATLRRQYQSIISTAIDCADGKPQHLCWECAHRAARHAAFVDTCLGAEILLSALYLERGQIKSGSVSAAERAAHGLCSRLAFGRFTATSFAAETKREHTDEISVKLEDFDHLREFSSDSQAFAGLNVPLVKPEQKPQEPASLDDYAHLQGLVEGHSVFSDDDSRHDEDDLPLIVTRNAKTNNNFTRSQTDRSQSRRHASNAEISQKPKRGIRPKVKRRGVASLEPDRTQKKRLKCKTAFSEDFARLIILSLDEQRAEFHERSNSLNYKNSPYKCDHCFKGYVDETTFKNHMARHDEASGEHLCQVCAIRYDTAKGLRDHELKLHSRRYQCRACPHQSVNTTQAHQHQNTAHLGQVPTYVCNVCGKTFKKISTHLTHVRLAHPSEFVCTACGDSFIGEHGLFVHRSKMHKLPSKRSCATPPPQRYCVECGLQFDNIEAFTKHTINSPKHTAGVENICRVCGAKFSDALELIEHRRIHRKHNKDVPKTFECKECEKKFRVGKALTVHIRRVHLGLKKSLDKNIVCELCGKSFTCRATLRYHQTKHTGERPYPCGECHKRFRDPQQLFLHRRTHTKEQPYRCSVCGKCFSQKCNLSRHMIIHSGEKPFACGECGRCFNQNSSLKGHVNAVHLGLPPPPRRSRHRVKQEKPVTAHAF